MELQCHYCKAGRAILDGGEFICDNCGIVLQPPEEYTISQPFYNKISEADTDTTQKYSKYRNIKPKKYVGRYRKYIDHEAIKIRNEQKSRIKSAIDVIAEKLGLNPEKVLNRFESHLKRVGINDILKTDNIITNKGHKRDPNVVAAGFVYNVFRNKLTIRQIKNAASCGNKSLQKVLTLIT